MNKITIDGNDYNFNDDGITHINIYSQGKTELGKFLSNFTYSPVETTHGHFLSLEGYYHYIKSILAIEQSPLRDVLLLTNHDRLEHLRKLYGKYAQQHGRAVRQELMAQGVWFDDTVSIIKLPWFVEALKYKIRTSNLVADFLESTLPFTHYYVYGNTVNHKPHYNDLSEVLNDLRINGV